jgi:hypothetical protein
MEVRSLRFEIGRQISLMGDPIAFKNRVTIGGLLINNFLVGRKIMMALPIIAPSLFIETLIVNFIGGKWKKDLKEYSFENVRPIAYRVCLRTLHQPDQRSAD